MAERSNEPPVMPVQRPVDTMDSTKTVVIEGRSYDSPKLFTAIEWLKNNADKRNWSLRDIEKEIGISKSWIAVARKYFENNKNGV